ncbi:MAG: response regulator [Alphaproteobacteria bacterium]|nr:response regulator [Alphaproteobacteria bacterium]
MKLYDAQYETPKAGMGYEESRLAALRRYDILDTGREDDYDDIARLAGQVCGTPIAIISFVDAERQWFKAHIGIEETETPRLWSICQETVKCGDVLVVPDASLDPRFKDLPMVAGEEHLRFYAGAPLLTSDGYGIGSLCVLDTRPNSLNEEQIESLRALARQVVRQLETRLILRQKELSEERFSFALSASAVVGTWDWHIPDDKVYADEGFAHIFGVEAEQARKGASIQEFFRNIHHEDKDALQVAIGNAIASGDKLVEEYRIVQADGSIRWIMARGQCQYIHNKPNRFPGVALDITDRKALEFRQLVLAELDVKLREYHTIPDIVHAAAELLGKTLDASRAGYAEIDENGEYATVTDDWRRDGQTTIAARHRFADYGTFVSELLVGRLLVIEDMLTDERASITEEQRNSSEGIGVRSLINVPLMENGRLVAVLFIHDDKPRQWKETEVNFVQEVARRTWDNAQRSKVHEALRESEEFARSIVESTPDGVKVLDLHGNLVSMNAIGAQHMDIDEHYEWRGKPWVSFWQGEGRDKAQKAIDSARIGVMTQFDGFRQTMKGVPKWWEVIVTPMFEYDGSVSRILAISRDVTARYESERALVEARNASEAANIAKTEFLANMSHEIRTPMNAVIGLANILAMSQPLTDKQREFIRTLQSSADSLLTLINDLLDIAKIESRAIELERVPFDLRRLVQEIISMLAVRAAEKGLEFRLESDGLPEGRQLLGDPTRLRQIILNLCANALKFTDHGSITVHISMSPTEEKHIHTICIAVQDTGIGIAPEKQETVFQKFMQADNSINRKYGGTGLGLAITRTLAEMMGGDITLKSELGKGSTFTVCLPLESAAPEDEEAEIFAELEALSESTKRRASGRRHRVLLVEDYEPNIIVAGNFLSHYGYEYDVARNGLEAIDRLKTERYDAVLMDVQMHGMNGLEATRHIRQHEQARGIPPVHIIGVTAHALTGDRERCIAAGMDDYISKPFNPDELDERISLALRNSTH